ncbi:MAG: hypothetical protein RMK98_08350, partial [Bacteroidia bacterium]|nr:hypothetical protein [Bacteroidia bacterium]
LLSLYELQAIPGFTEQTWQMLRPFITVRPATTLDIGEGPTQIPSFRQIVSQGRFTFIQRLQQSLEAFHEGRGWMPEPPLSQALGPPQRLYTRLQLQAGPYFSAALIGEKDPYEPLFWRPAQRYYGYDFVSGHIAIGEMGELKRLVLGDFILQVGQGLVFARGLGFGKGGEPILTLKQPSFGLVPYTSVNEYQFGRGAAATLQLSPRWELTALAARQRQSATLADSLDELPRAATLLLTGLHRTPSEFARRGTLLQEGLGGVLTWRKRWHSAGFTALYQRFTPMLDLSTNEPYRLFAFHGKENFLYSGFWDFTLANLNFFGEAAQSRSGGKAISSSIIAALHPTLDVALQLRHFDPQFHSFYAYTFAERSYAVQNEQGIYLGLRVRPTPRWEITAFHDLYRFLWYQYRLNTPAEGHENLFQLTYTVRKKLQIYLRVRHEVRPYNEPAEQAASPLYRTILHARTAMRLHGMYEIQPSWRYQTRVEVVRYHSDTLFWGYLFYQELRWQPRPRWSLVVRWVGYAIPDYDARIYTFEPMPPTTFAIPGFYGVGHRYFLLLKVQMSRAWTLWLRWGENTFYLPVDKEHRRVQEALLQVRYQIGG